MIDIGVRALRAALAEDDGAFDAVHLIAFTPEEQAALAEVLDASREDP